MSTLPEGPEPMSDEQIHRLPMKNLDSLEKGSPEWREQAKRRMDSICYGARSFDKEGKLTDLHSSTRQIDPRTGDFTLLVIRPARATVIALGAKTDEAKRAAQLAGNASQDAEAESLRRHFSYYFFNHEDADWKDISVAYTDAELVRTARLLGIENPENATWKDIDAKREEQTETWRRVHSHSLFGHENATWEQISEAEQQRYQVAEPVREAVQLTSIEVQGYAVPVNVLEGFPDILRTDKKTTISLHPDDVVAFKSLREKIGIAIIAENEETEINGSEINVSNRLIGILKDHGIIVSPGREGHFNVSWPQQ